MRELHSKICRRIGAFGIGYGAAEMLIHNYEVASWVLLIVSVLFVIDSFITLLYSMN